MNFEKISDICSTILIICDLSTNLDYDVNKDYRAKVDKMVVEEIKKLNDLST